MNTASLPHELQSIVWSYYVCAMRIRMFKRSLKSSTTYLSVEQFSDDAYYGGHCPKLTTVADGRIWVLRNNDDLDPNGISGIVYNGVSGTRHLFTELLCITDPSARVMLKNEYEREVGNCDKINVFYYWNNGNGRWILLPYC